MCEDCCQERLDTPAIRTTLYDGLTEGESGPGH